MNPYVEHVRPLANYRLEVVFENGERRIFDAKPYLRRGVSRINTRPGMMFDCRLKAESI
jgi:hypothetical protein